MVSNLSNSQIDPKVYYLEQILILVNMENAPGCDFRTLIDSWYAHHMGTGFVTKKGNVQWFNRGQLKKPSRLPAILQMHFISRDAWEVLHSQDRTLEVALVKDHAVPVKILFQELKKLSGANSPLSLRSVENFLLERYRVGIITKDEDYRLNDKKLRSALPSHCTHAFSRYDQCEILKHPEHGHSRHVRPEALANRQD